jgi:hypothetical protein
MFAYLLHSATYFLADPWDNCLSDIFLSYSSNCLRLIRVLFPIFNVNWEKKCLTVEEAAAYSGIGERRLKALLMDKDCSFRIARSDRLLIIREKLEEFIDSSTEL